MLESVGCKHAINTMKSILGKKFQHVGAALANLVAVLPQSSAERRGLGTIAEAKQQKSTPPKTQATNKQTNPQTSKQQEKFH